MACPDSTVPVVGGFSSDDEKEVHDLNMLPEKPSKKQKVSSRHVLATNGGADTEDEDHSVIEEVLHLNDEQLLEKLRAFNLDAGPVVDTTRVFYKKMLTRLLNDGTPAKNGERECAKDEAGQVPNGRGSEDDILVGAGENKDKSDEYFSADDEANEGDNDNVFFTAKKFKPRVSNKNTSFLTASPSPDELRNRVSGSVTKTNKDGNATRFVPTPRRSLLSYKMEKSSAYWTKSDGTQSDEFYKTVTTTINDVAEEGGKISVLLKYLPSILLLLIFATLGYYIYLGVGMGILSPLLSKIEIIFYGCKDLLLGGKESILGGQDKEEAF